MRIFSTQHHLDWWKNRPIDWAKDYLSTWNHPHRWYLAQKLKEVKWASIYEVGTGAGANPYALSKVFPQAALGGSDVSEEAIKVAQQAIPHGIFDVCPGNDIIMSSHSADVVLTDMTLIYVDPFKIKSYLKEFQRIGRKYVFLVEFYHPSLWKRLKMTLAGRYTHNYPKLLEKLGCHGILIHKLPSDLYPGAHDNEYRYLITARI